MVEMQQASSRLPASAIIDIEHHARRNRYLGRRHFCQRRSRLPPLFHSRLRVLTEIPYTEHLPAIQACRFLSLKATYSRSKCSAEKLAENATKTIDCYFDLPFSPGRSLTDLLERDDIDAVVIALPIVVQPEVIKRAITAGKHVLSERPIAKDMKTATELIRWYRNPQPKGIWSVAENFRFMSLMSSGAEQIKVIGGDVVTFGVKLYGFVGEDDKYYQTPWYKTPTYIRMQTYLTSLN